MADPGVIGLLVECRDEPGVLHRITEVILRHGANISYVAGGARGGPVAEIQLEVSGAVDQDQLTADAEAVCANIRNAGAIFIGPHTPEAIGDYVGGSNHVLPTARSARFSSGLGVLDFMKRTSILRCGPDQLRALGPAAMALGKAEGLDAHARSVGLRLNLP